MRTMVSPETHPGMQGVDAANPAAVLWDMDGTLIDSEPYWIAAEHELAALYGVTWTEKDSAELVGNALMTSARIIRRKMAISMAEVDIVDFLQSRVVAQVRTKVPWRPGARELLDELTSAGIPCALVTMSYQQFSGAVVDQLPPGTFQAVISGDLVDNGKPHPEPYLRAAHLLGVDPTACVALEDSPSGIASAAAAGARVIAIPLMVPIAPAPHLSMVGSLTDVGLPLLREIMSGRSVNTMPTAP